MHQVVVGTIPRDPKTVQGTSSGWLIRSLRRQQSSDTIVTLDINCAAVCFHK
jgi:hypothetical protein